MRYFKCPKTGLTEKLALKAEYEELNIEEQRVARKEKMKDRVAVVLLFTVSGICLVCCGWIIWRIPRPENLVLEILLYGTLTFVAVIVSFAIGAFASLPFFAGKK